MLIRSSYQPFRGSKGWVAASLKWFATLPRDLRTFACSGHSLRHWTAISPANSQSDRTPPSLRASHFPTWASCCWGNSPEAEELRSSPIQLAVLADFLWSSSDRLISVKCSFYLANPNPNFSYKIGIFACQFACPVVSAYLYTNKKYRDLGYYNSDPS